MREQGQLNKEMLADREVLKQQPEHPIPHPHLRQLRSQASRTAIGILGMHRSGTSCLAGSLQAAGLFGGQVLEWNSDNLKGHRENQDIMDLSNDILEANEGSWDKPPAEIQWLPQHAQQRDALVAQFDRHAHVWMFKDPRTVLMLPFWQEGIADLQLIGTFRHPLKVAMSLYERSQSRVSLRHGIELWLHYNRCLLDTFRQAPFPLLCFDLSPDEYLTRLEQLLQDLKTQLGERVSLSIAAAREFYETTLVRQPDWIPWLNRENPTQNNENAQLIATARELYQELRQAARLSEDTTPSPDAAYFLPVEETLEACQEVLKLQPDNPYTYFIQGHIQRQQEDTQEAIASYRKALELAPEHLVFSQSLSTALTQTGDLEGAKTTYLEALKFGPDNPLTYHLLANIQQKQGDIENAIASYRKAIEIYPEHLISYLSLGRLLTQQEQLNAAGKVYEQALELQPEHPAIYCHLGHYQRRQQNLEGAIAHYQTAIELNPDYVEAYIQQGITLHQKGEWEEAIARYQKALQLEPERSGVYFQLANTQRQQGNLEAAIGNYQKEIELNSSHREVDFQLANTFNRQGKLEEAIAHYQRAIQLQPERAGFYIQLANVQRKQGNLKEAVLNYQKALELNPQKPAIVYKSLGETFGQLQKYEEAIDAYQESLKLQPKNPEVRRGLKRLKARDSGNF